MRRQRSELEAALSDTIVTTAKEKTPGLYEAVRHALDKGALPKDVRRRFGLAPARNNMTALSVEWIVDEWEREHGLVKPEESIDDIE